VTDRVYLTADRFERDLPQLPVPTLEETADRYLSSIQPYHTSPSPFAPNDPLPSFDKSKAAISAFLDSSLVHALQARLQDRAKTEPSWLADWWNETAYFGWRGPVVPGVNYFYVHKDDKSRRSASKRAAGLVRALMYFREMTESSVEWNAGYQSLLRQSNS
jgi:carnitine O-acetyltransferase